jgi:hypothetical protein
LAPPAHLATPLTHLGDLARPGLDPNSRPPP